MRLGAGQSSATLEILHIVRRVTTLSQANIWSRTGLQISNSMQLVRG
jgi:hypothetical protein